MNQIYWGKERIGLLSDHLNADKHSHLMLQLFLGLEESLEIEAAGEKITCKCIVLDKNVPHVFRAKDKLHFSYLIAPASATAEQLSQKMNLKGYWICDGDKLAHVRRQAKGLSGNMDAQAYIAFMAVFDACLGVYPDNKKYDGRVMELLSLLQTCLCEDHTIAEFAEKISLSPSRLSHLFKEETGVPLKSYIVLHQLERAFMELLAGSNITSAAMKAGFDSPSHFAATVKRMMGMPASASLKDSVFLKV